MIGNLNLLFDDLSLLAPMRSILFVESFLDSGNRLLGNLLLVQALRDDLALEMFHFTALWSDGGMRQRLAQRTGEFH